jgi:hypothetical protein
MSTLHDLESTKECSCAFVSPLWLVVLVSFQGRARADGTIFQMRLAADSRTTPAEIFTLKANSSTETIALEPTVSIDDDDIQSAEVQPVQEDGPK